MHAMVCVYVGLSIRSKYTCGLGDQLKRKHRNMYFSGIMKAPLYIQIIERSLLPFLHGAFPDGHRFMQDNDPKYTSRLAHAFFEDNGVHWWKTPAESPDANPIENLWHELK